LDVRSLVTEKAAANRTMLDRPWRVRETSSGAAGRARRKLAKWGGAGIEEIAPDANRGDGTVIRRFADARRAILGPGSIS